MKIGKDIKLRYDFYEIKYFLNNKEYVITYKKGKSLSCVDEVEVSILEVELPSKVLEIAFMINDKFTFNAPSEEIYSYLGITRTSHATWTTTLVKKLLIV